LRSIKKADTNRVCFFYAENSRHVTEKQNITVNNLRQSRRLAVADPSKEPDRNRLKNKTIYPA
jgi:ABC-type molybdate transport system substrate-binding protein